MDKEALEDIIVLDAAQNKIMNFSSVIPEELKKLDLTEDFEHLLTPDQIPLELFHYSDHDRSNKDQWIIENGGSFFKDRTLKQLLALPIFKGAK